jgi:hypothetical protein
MPAMDSCNIVEFPVAKLWNSHLQLSPLLSCNKYAGICDWYADKYVAGTDSLGRLSAQLEIDRLRRLKRAGKNVDYIIFDHPLTRAIYPNEDYSLPARMTCA